MTTFVPIALLLEPAHAGTSANFETWTRRVLLGTDFLYPFTLPDPGAGRHATWVLYHEIGHAFEDLFDLMDQDFTAPLGVFDFERMAFVVPRPTPVKSWQASESTYKNPSEAVASVFADYVLEPARLRPEQVTWVEARLVEHPEWARAVAVLRASDPVSLVRSGWFDPGRVRR